jgi:hypothetical protein
VTQPPPPELPFDEFQRIYGRVEALSPAQAAELFTGAPFRWWVAGGWSVELNPEPRRIHEDLEVAIPRSDLPGVREWLRDYHLWDTHAGTLTFLGPGVELPPATGTSAIDHEQLWVRRDAYSPWLMDLMLAPVEDGTWYYKRDRRISRPLAEVVRMSAGVPYQRPEVTLLYKARRRATKDEADFAAVVPRLSPADRAWLHAAIALTEPAGHPWIEQLK